MLKTDKEQHPPGCGGNGAVKEVSILIPTYNGREILEECLPSVAAEVERRGRIDEVIIIDNAGGDGTGEFIKNNYPWMRILRLNENKAIFAINDGAEAAGKELLFFLNDDMILKPGCIDALTAVFDSDDVFAATGKVYTWDRVSVQAERRKPVFHRGRFWYLPADAPDAPGPTLHALGGQSIIDRDKFKALGGLDTLFSPFYHEDLDLSWRAMKRGWRIIYEPCAEMVHKGAATAGKMYSKEQILSIMQKNMFLFTWKNMHELPLIFEHFAWLPVHTVKAALKGDRIFLNGLIMALGKASEVTGKRRSARSESIVSDGDVLKSFEMGS